MKLLDLDYITIRKFILDEKIFKLDGCPAWAEWAAVDSRGEVYLFSRKPKCGDSGWIPPEGSSWQVLLTYERFDNTDWEDSLIRRPNEVLVVTMKDVEAKFGCKVKIVK